MEKYKYNIFVSIPFDFVEAGTDEEGKDRSFYQASVTVRIENFYDGLSIEGSFSAYKESDKPLDIDWLPLCGAGEIDGYYQLFAGSDEAGRNLIQYVGNHAQMKREIRQLFEEEWKKVRLRALFRTRKGDGDGDV